MQISRTRLLGLECLMGRSLIVCGSEHAADVGVVELFLVVHAVTTSRGPNEVAIDQARAVGVLADEGDELLFPFYYLPNDSERASDQRHVGIATLLEIPSGAFDAMQRELSLH